MGCMRWQIHIINCGLLDGTRFSFVFLTMSLQFPLNYNLQDGTHVVVKRAEAHLFDFYLTRLNSEKHNFSWKADSNEIEESYETRFDLLQQEAIGQLREMLSKEG